MTRPQPPTTLAMMSSVVLPAAFMPGASRVSSSEAKLIRIVAPRNKARKLATKPLGRKRSDRKANPNMFTLRVRITGRWRFAGSGR